MQRNRNFLRKRKFSESLFLHVILILITFFFLFFSCRKDKENLPPEISVLLPQAGILLNATDSVQVKVDVSDDSGPLSVSVYIADGSNTSLTNPMVRTSSDNKISINELYVFNNKYIESGNYFLVIHVEDGKNQVNKFISVSITGISLELTSVYVGVEDLSGLKIFCRDTSGAYSQVSFVPGTYEDFMINNYSQQLYLLGTNGCLSCYSLPALQKEWESCGLSITGNTFNGQLMEYNFHTYVTDANGYIKAFDKEGVLRKAFSLPSGSPERFNFCDSKLLISVFDYQTLKRYIQVLSLSGGVLNTYQVNFNPGRFYVYSTNTVMVFCESSGQSLMKTYNTEINYLYPFGTGFPEHFIDAIETPDNQYLLSTSDNLRVIEKNYGNSNLYALNHLADIFKFEKTSNLLYMADSNNLSVFNYPGSQIYTSYNFSGKIIFFDFLYNK